MRNTIAAPAVAVAGGAVGLGLRAWGLASAFEPDTGLPIPGMPATWSLILLSALVAAALALLCRGKRAAFEGGYDQAYAAKGNTLYITAVVLAAFLLLASGALNVLYVLRRDGVPITRLVLAALSVAVAPCVIAVGKNNYKGEKRGRFSLPLLMPGYVCCVWLITSYQVRAGDPVQLDYIYELFAIIAVLVGIYFSAGFAFERPKFFCAAFFSLLGVYFSVVTLADRHDLATTLLYGFAILYLLAHTISLLYNASRPAAVPRRPQAEQPDTDDDMEGTIHEP